MSADMWQAHRWPPASVMSSMNSGTVGRSRPSICLRIMWVAKACMPGRPMTAVGMWVAGLPTGLNARWSMVLLLIMSNPQNVKNRWVSMPSPSAALASTRPG